LFLLIFVTATVTQELSREEVMSDHFEVTWNHDSVYSGYQVMSTAHTDFKFSVWDSCGAGKCDLTTTIVHEKFQNLTVNGFKTDRYVPVEFKIRRLSRYELDHMRKSVFVKWPKLDLAREYIVYKLVPIGEKSNRYDIVFRSCERNCLDNAEMLSIPVGPGETFKVMAMKEIMQLTPEVKITEY